jgi:hypothetical protein
MMTQHGQHQRVISKRLTPVNITVDDKGKQPSDGVSLGYCVLSRQRSEHSFAKNKMGASTTDKVIGSVQNLEYSIADALNKVTTDKQKRLQ